MTVESLRAAVEPVLLVAQIVATYTKTEKDDKAVRLLQKIIHDDEIAGGICELLSKEGA